MNLKDLPIGNSTSVDNGELITTATRINSEYVIVDQIEKNTGNSILKTKVHVETGHTETQHIDYNFWTIYVDGSPYDGKPVSGAIQTDPTKRIMNITTS